MKLIKIVKMSFARSKRTPSAPPFAGIPIRAGSSPQYTVLVETQKTSSCNGSFNIVISVLAQYPQSNLSNKATVSKNRWRQLITRICLTL
jgi:hypothetical protein